MLTPNHWPRDQMANASSSNATATRWSLAPSLARSSCPPRRSCTKPCPTIDGPARAIRAAHAIRTELAEHGLQIRVGLHTGECELVGDDIGLLVQSLKLCAVAGMVRLGLVALDGTKVEANAAASIGWPGRAAGPAATGQALLEAEAAARQQRYQQHAVTSRCRWVQQSVPASRSAEMRTEVNASAHSRR
jgi:hypothetical protein